MIKPIDYYKKPPSLACHKLAWSADLNQSRAILGLCFVRFLNLMVTNFLRPRLTFLAFVMSYFSTGWPRMLLMITVASLICAGQLCVKVTSKACIVANKKSWTKRSLTCIVRLCHINMLPCTCNAVGGSSYHHAHSGNVTRSKIDTCSCVGLPNDPRSPGRSVHPFRFWSLQARQ